MIELLKFDRPEQFPRDEILNDNERIVRSWMTVEAKDLQGDIIPMEEFRKVMHTWFKRGAPIQDTHTNRNVGRALNWQEAIHPETNTPAIILDYQIYKDYAIDDRVWEEIKGGKRTGLSIGGQATGVPEMKEDEVSGEMARSIRGLELFEVSSVASPANQYATNMAVNFLAKDKDGAVTITTTKEQIEQANQLAKDLQKGYAAEDIQKPFAGFKDFEACTIAQRERGHSPDSAERICGWLKNRTEDKAEEKPKPKVDEKNDVTSTEARNDKSEESLHKAEPSGSNVEKKAMEVVKVEETIMKESEKPSPADDTKERLEKLEKSVEALLKGQEAILKSLNKAEEEKKPEDKEDCKKEAAEDKKEEEAEKVKKEKADNQPGKSEVEKEVKAPTLEGSPSIEKAMKDFESRIDAKVSEILKSAVKVSTPRVDQGVADIEKAAKTANKELAMDFIEKSRSQIMNPGAMNQEIKARAKAEYKDRVSQVLNS